MNLLEIRTQVAKASGRYDLIIADTYANAGIDFYINAGQRWLNNKSAIPRAFAHLSGILELSDYVYKIANKFKELSSVIVNGIGDIDRALTYKTLPELQSLYDTDTKPLYYTYATQRTLATATTKTLAEFVNLKWLIDEDDYNDYSGIIITPSPQIDYTITVAGRFFPTELSDDTDTNFWSEEYPELLILSALRSLAAFMCDFEKVKYFEEIIRIETGIPFRTLTPDRN